MSDEIESKADATGQEAHPSKRRKKAGIVIGIAAAVVVVAGAAFMVWHEQPSFCNAICHSPMDDYVEGYYSEDDGLLAVAHRYEEVECLDCHEPTIGQQIQEGIAWVTGNYYVPLEERDLGDEGMCLNGACHVKEDIVAATADWGGEGFNPHENHLSRDLECGDCHNAHRVSALYCNECHYSDSPEGWAD